jgi:small subunit ribosomal protein S3
MGQKVHPGGLRVGIIHDWKSNWYSEKDFSRYLLEDLRIRDHIYARLAHAGLSDIHIRKDSQKITIDIFTARPGIVIGKSGSEVDALRKQVFAMTGRSVQININEIKRPELDAKLMAQSVAEQLQNRVSFRRAMKRSLASAVRSGAQGVKVRCGGRLGGTEMSRSEQYSEGRVPLHTLRADIDYGFTEARTTYGRIGVKVWINKGEIMPEGYEGSTGQPTRLGEVDARRRRGGARGAVEELGPARPQRGRRPGGPGAGGPGGDRQGGGRPGGPGGPGGAGGYGAGGAGGGRGRPGGGGPGGPRGRDGQPTGPAGPSSPIGRRPRPRVAEAPTPNPAASVPAEGTVADTARRPRPRPTCPGPLGRPSPTSAHAPHERCARR